MLVESIALFGLALSTLSSSRAPKARKTRERLFGVPVPRGAVLGSKGDSELYLCIHGLDPEEFDPEQWMVIGHIRKDGAICYPYTTLYDSDSPIDEIVGETIPRGEPFSWYLDKMDDKGIRYELIGPWRRESEKVELGPRTLWRLLGVDEYEPPSPTIEMTPKSIDGGMIGEETKTPRICTAPSPELCVIGASPSGRSVDGNYAFYRNRDPVDAVLPSQLALPDQPITGEMWLTGPATFELAFVLTERQTETLDDFVRDMAETDTDNIVKILRGINDRLRRWGYLA